MVPGFPFPVEAWRGMANWEAQGRENLKRLHLKSEWDFGLRQKESPIES